MRSRRRIDSSIIAHPVNLRWERLLKCYAKNSTYIYMTLSIIDMDFLYQFNLRLIAPLFSFFSWNVWKKKVFQDFQKLAGLWLVGEMDNHVGIYGSKVAEGFSAFQRRVLYHVQYQDVVMYDKNMHVWRSMNTILLALGGYRVMVRFRVFSCPKEFCSNALWSISVTRLSYLKPWKGFR